MKKLRIPSIFAALLTAVYSVKAQPPPVPDCIVPFDTGAGAVAATYNFPGGNGMDNRTLGCVTWTLEWQSSTTATVTFQSSLGAASPTSYGTYTGTTVNSGTDIATYSNLLSGGTSVVTPWVRVNIVTSGTGQTKGVLFGYRTGYTGGSGGGVGGGGGGGGGPFGNFTGGQQAVTASAAALPNNAAKSVCVENDPAGSPPTIYIGASGVTTATGFALLPGQATCQPVSNTDLIYVVAGATGATADFVWVN